MVTGNDFVVSITMLYPADLYHHSMSWPPCRAPWWPPSHDAVGLWDPGYETDSHGTTQINCSPITLDYILSFCCYYGHFAFCASPFAVIYSTGSASTLLLGMNIMLNPLLIIRNSYTHERNHVLKYNPPSPPHYYNFYFLMDRPWCMARHGLVKG